MSPPKASSNLQASPTLSFRSVSYPAPLVAPTTPPSLTRAPVSDPLPRGPSPSLLGHALIPSIMHGTDHASMSSPFSSTENLESASSVADSDVDGARVSDLSRSWFKRMHKFSPRPWKETPKTKKLVPVPKEQTEAWTRTRSVSPDL